MLCKNIIPKLKQLKTTACSRSWDEGWAVSLDGSSLRGADRLAYTLQSAEQQCLAEDYCAHLSKAISMFLGMTE